MERAVAGDAGIIDQDLHRAEIGFNPGDACLTGVEIGYIDLVDGDAGRFFEFLGCLVVTAIDGRNRVPFVFQLFGNHPADSAGTAGDDRYSRHIALLLFIQRRLHPGERRYTFRFFGSAQSCRLRS